MPGLLPWTRPPQPLPIRLDRRRIYVLPTPAGLFLGALVLAMILGALNYNNNPALLLSFLLASCLHTALLQGYLGLRGLALVAATATPVHAGESVALRLAFDGGARTRRGIVVRCGAQEAVIDASANAAAEATLSLPTSRRGWFDIDRLLVFTRHPLGLFRVWSWMHPDRRVLVYPALETSPPPLPREGGDGPARRRRGPLEEPHSLRDYRVGDPMRLVAWKRSAQRGQLLVREFESPHGGEVTLDWHALASLPAEARIRRLARWVVDAEREGAHSLLVLPAERIGPASGPVHVHACLRALALLPHA